MPLLRGVSMGNRSFSRWSTAALATALFAAMVFASSTAIASPAIKRATRPVAGTIGIATVGIGENIAGATPLPMVGGTAAFSGHLTADAIGGEDDVFDIFLTAGEVVTVDMTAADPATTDFAVYLFGPDATDIWSMDEDPLAYVDPSFWNEEGVKEPLTISSFKAPKTGHYFIDAFTAVGGDYSGGSGDYTLIVNVERRGTIVAIANQPTSALAFKDSTAIMGHVYYAYDLLYSGLWNVVAAGDVTLLASDDGSDYFPLGTQTLEADGSYLFETPVYDRKMHYLVQFSGTGALTPSTAYASVNMYASLTNASASRYGIRSYTLSGILAPRHTAGSSAVRVYLWRYVSGKWKASGYATAKASDYGFKSKYSVKYKFPYTGKWRMQAYHSDSSHATTRSGYSYVTVK
jgi:hypothetical protein